ncbi:MAG: RDD family protein [Rhodospirillaceae bacterium]|nr:RDD family protein [Rhodospirillaceae bacterium]
MTPTGTADAVPVRRGGRLEREIVTPDGVPLHMTLADRGHRASAFVIDMVILAATLLALSLMLVIAGTDVLRESWILSFFLLAAFFLRNFYFAVFELRWQGATLGKRVVGLRVIDRHGGRLEADAVLARNFMREIEVFLPLTLAAMAQVEDTSDRWLVMPALVWASLFLLMPFFNRDNLRVGDMVAGTWVVIAPKAMLLPDLVDPAGPQPGQAADSPAYRFTPAQLDAYGAFELQTLEGVLRRKGSPTYDEIEAEVCRRIRRKIGWDAQNPPPDAGPFLDDFYAALRAHLEGRLLMGKRRENKYDR